MDGRMGEREGRVGWMEIRGKDGRMERREGSLGER